MLIFILFRYVSCERVCLTETNFTVLRNDRNIVSVEEAEKVKVYVNKVYSIKDVLKRDHMKVAFFGR